MLKRILLSITCLLFVASLGCNGGGGGEAEKPATVPDRSEAGGTGGETPAATGEAEGSAGAGPLAPDA